MQLGMPCTTQSVLKSLTSDANGVPGRFSTLFRSRQVNVSGYSRFRPVLSTIGEESSKVFNHRRNGIGKMVQGDGSECTNSRATVEWCSDKLRDCSLQMSTTRGKSIHCFVIRNEIEPDSHLWISLINFYSKCGYLRCARQVFDKMPAKCVVSWTALISGFVSQGMVAESIELYCAMKAEGVRPNEFTLATVLKGSSMSSDSQTGRQLHADVVKHGVLSDAYIASALIDLYAKFEEMPDAYEVFHMLPRKTPVLWNVMLNGYAEQGNGEKVLELFCEITTEPEISFDNCTLSIVFKGVVGLEDLRVCRAVHSMAIKAKGEEFDDFVRCSLVNMYSKFGKTEDAYKIFLTINRPDSVAWCSIISMFDRQGSKEESVRMFRKMQRSGVRPNQFTLSSVLSAATDIGDVRYGRSIHSCAYKLGFESDVLVSNALIGMYAEFGSIHDGYSLFDRMVNPDVVSWNSLLSGFHNDGSDQGIKIFRQMLVEGFNPNVHTFISILRASSSSSNVETGKQIHSLVVKNSWADHAHIGAALIDVYTKCGCIEDAETVFKRLDEKDVFSWTAMISGHSQSNRGEKAAHLFNRMRREGFVPNEFTLASCLRACSSISSLELGRQLHSLSIKSGNSDDVFAASSLIDMYGKCGCMDDAEKAFDGIPAGDAVLWNTIICGYSQHGDGEKAFGAFKDMLAAGVLPDKVTFIGILSACSRRGLVEEARSHFSSMAETYGITPEIEHYACMVDVFGRAGKFDDVEATIEEMDVAPDSSIWENVLGACKLHGNIELGEKAARKLFELDPDTDSNYILLSNLYSGGKRWTDASRVRASMTGKGVKKEPGCSWMEIDSRVHVFLSGDVSHPRLAEIQDKLEELNRGAVEAGYVANVEIVLRNVTESEKRESLFHHSERLALGFSLIGKANGGGKIRIFKNLRICADCHEFMKFVSMTMSPAREIVIRDAKRFHHFRNGACSCRDYW
ncbi:hypothetical protein M569_02714 [Genlisea aurea]|uniref:DYW domain-containing protein n=1 Tax=Genlisea aurea TaxID=192259 RepID=S8CXA1_9LAMI|nr:hypothetical protein M569_02714 [Genlisea aurea]